MVNDNRRSGKGGNVDKDEILNYFDSSFEGDGNAHERHRAAVDVDEEGGARAAVPQPSKRQAASGLGYLALERHVPLRYTHHTTTIPQIPRCISNASRGPHRLSTFLLHFYHLPSNTGAIS